MPQATSSVRAGGSAAIALRAPRPPRPSRDGRARRSGRRRATSRRTPAHAGRSTPSRFLEYARGAAARVRAELLGGARPGDDRRDRRRARGARAAARRPRGRGSQPLGLHARRRRGELVEALLAGIACARRADRPAAARGRASAHRRGRRRPDRAARPRGRGAGARAARCGSRERVGEELGLPVFLYGELGDGRGPAFFRQRRAEELQRRIDAGELAPDFGPPRLDESAGGVLVGARRPLIAFNVNLRGDARGGAGDRCARARARRRLSRRAGARPRAAARGAGAGEHERRGLGGRGAARRSSRVSSARRRRAGRRWSGAELVGLMPAGAARRRRGRGAADRRLRRLARAGAAAARD